MKHLLYVVFIQEAQYRWALALGYPNDLSTGSRVLGAFKLIAKTLENHLKWPKQFVFLGQYMFLHFFKDYFLQCDYLKNTNLHSVRSYAQATVSESRMTAFFYST